jgi:hypothetical protein
MAIGTGLAIGLGLAASAMRDAYGTQQQVYQDQQRWANQAYQDQQRAAQHAYGMQMSLMDPYAQVGRNAMQTLGALTTPGVSFTPQAQQQMAQGNAMRPHAWSPQPSPFVPMGHYGGPPPGGPQMAGPPPMQARTPGPMIARPPMVPFGSYGQRPMGA